MRGRYFCEGNREGKEKETQKEAKHFSCAEQRSVCKQVCVRDFCRSR